MKTIIEQRYNSTYGFVESNELEKEAEELFGKNWEAEDDVNQIQSLINHLGHRDLFVSFIEGLQEDDILVSNSNPTGFSYEYYKLPKKIKNLIDSFSEEGSDYDKLDELTNKLSILGWTMVYGLDGGITDVYKTAKKTKKLHVKKTTISEVSTKWGINASCLIGKSFYVRCNSKGIVNWEVAPIFSADELIERDKVIIL